jgi:DNA-binding LytR/AlgR family response regulator
MALRVVLVEDEPASRDRLRRLLKQHEATVSIVAEADNGPAAVEVIRQHEPDLVLLDISLPGMDGFEVLKALPEPPSVIFTTAFDAHAVQAFRANALDYLLKPIEAEQLAIALARATRARATPEPAPSQASPTAAKHKPMRRVACRVGDSTFFVNIDDVHYFRADHGYTLVKTELKELLIETPLIELEARLDQAEFVRIHRNTLVNMKHVSSLKRLLDGRIQVVLQSGEELPSSRRYADNLRNLE